MNKRPGFVYLMASRRGGALYLGVTNDLVRRGWEHRNATGGVHAARYRCRNLVWFEAHDDIQEARARELQMMKWKRAWKVELIERMNPGWRDLWPDICG